jgi:hypothetical protein
MLPAEPLSPLGGMPPPPSGQPFAFSGVLAGPAEVVSPAPSPSPGGVVTLTWTSLRCMLKLGSNGGRALRPRYLLIIPIGAVVAILVWYAMVVGWAIVLRRMGQSVSTWEQLEDSSRQARGRMSD